MGTMTETERKALAQEMLAAQDEARSIVPISTRGVPFSVDDAYAVSATVHAARLARGWRSVGRKIGFTNYAMWTRYGVHAPIWAHVYDRTVRRLDEVDGRHALRALVEPKIEPEIVFHLGTTPPPGAGPDALLAAIDWVAPAFELVQSHAPGWRFTAADTVADAALHGALLLGAPVPLAALGPDAAAQLARFTLDLACDGTLVETGSGAQVLDSPLLALAHLAAVLQQQGAAPLVAGEVITTGTITTAQAVAPGQRWRAELQGLALAPIELRLD